MSTQTVRKIVEDLGEYAQLLIDCAQDLRRGSFSFAETTRQVVKIGADSTPVVALTAIFTGMVLALQTAYGLQRFGAKDYVGNVSGLAFIRELGPVLSALMVCGRVGAGTAAEISSMVVTEQVDAIRALGANPISKLVTPRVLACILIMPMLTIGSNLLGIYGGALVATLQLDVDSHQYFHSLLNTVRIRDVIEGLIKSVAFGLIISTVACYKGLNSRGGTEGVGMSTTASVVTGSMTVLVIDFLLTKLMLMF